MGLSAGPVTAVLFDLWGTLVPFPARRRDEVVASMAGDLGVDPAAFAAAYRRSHPERFTGGSGTLEETLRWLARACDGEPGPAALAKAAARRLAFTRALLAAEPGTLAVLDVLCARGFVLGLVSDSSVETPTVWPESELAPRFAATSFSCLVGARKPQAELYLACCSALGVEPHACAYVGDGGGRELSAAAGLDMRAVRLRRPDDDPSGRYDDDAGFSGPEIAGLPQMLELPWAASAGSGSARRASPPRHSSRASD